MKKEFSVIKLKAFSLIEVILAIALFSLYSTSIIVFITHGEESILRVGQKAKASFLAEEGIEATRAIRNENFENLIDGSYGIDSVSGKWQLVSSPTQIDGFSREITISTVDNNTKKITSKISWSKRDGSSTFLEFLTQLTNWDSYSGVPGFGDWRNPFMESFLTLMGGKDGIKVQVKDNFCYVVRDSAADSFVSIDITDTLHPLLGFENNLKDNPKNLYIHNDLVLIATKSNSAELQIADILDPTSPIMKGEFDAEGNPDASGIYAKDNYVYLTRLNGSGPELLIIDVSDPDYPQSLGSLELEKNANEIVVLGDFAYIASGPNGYQLMTIDIKDPAQPSVVGHFSLPEDQNALTIAGFESTVIIGTEKGVIYAFDVTDPTNPLKKGEIALRDNANNKVNDMALGLDNHYIFTVSDVPNREFQVYDISDISSPFFISSFDTPNALFGVAYDNAKDRAFAVGTANEKSLIIIAPKQQQP